MSPENEKCEAYQTPEPLHQSPIVQFAVFVLLFAVFFIGVLQLFGTQPN